MNEEDYITSGILQDYCLGLLTHEEESRVEAICHAYPEVARELKLLHSALEKYAAANKTAHRVELRRAVWESVKKLWEENP